MKPARVLLRLSLLLALAGIALFVARRKLFTAYAGTEPIAIDAVAAPVTFERAFPNLEFERPVFVTFPPDGSNRVVVLSQFGSVYIFSNDPDVAEATKMLDIRHKVMSKEGSNEEGLLGLAFHPRFRENRQFFVFYTNLEHVNVLSRFRMSAGDSNRAEPASEEELFRTPKRESRNHNGGTILFGADGFLYMAIGDGGPVGDPHGNGQSLRTVLGKILRIDVDRQDAGLKYAIPKDNPFAGRPNARGEIWAFGLRNVWRMAFDRQTNRLWAGDVGDDTWEEIDIIERGGNYGWKAKEGFRPFTTKQPTTTSPPTAIAADVIDPIFAYDHTIGNCIVGGCVYRGTRVPQLVGSYLFADNVTGQVYALRYDEKSGQAVSVQKIDPRTMAIFSFGEDEAGEVYFTTSQGIINHFVPAEKSATSDPSAR